MRLVFNDLEVNVDCIENFYGPLRNPLNAEQLLEIWHNMRRIHAHARVKVNAVYMDSCTSAEVRDILDTIKRVAESGGLLGKNALCCHSVLDLDTNDYLGHIYEHDTSDIIKHVEEEEGEE